MKQMSVFEFLTKYLTDGAIVTLCEDNGNINYTGPVGAAPQWTWGGRDLIRVEGLGEMDDIFVVTSKRNIGTRRTAK